MRFASVFAPLCLALCLSAPFALTRAARADVLWDQLSASGYGFKSQDYETAYDYYDCLTADDFTVPEPGCIIEAVEWDMILYYGSEAPVHGIHIYIMPDRGDNLGDYDNPVYYEFAPVQTVYDGTNIVTLTTPAALAPGHYFFGAAPALDWATYSSCYFEATTYAPVGQEMHMINPGGGFGSGSDWFQPAEGHDASFRLYGESYDAGAPDAVIDLPVGDMVIYPGDHVLFAGTAIDHNGQIVDWLWTFGEGSGVDDMHVEDPGPVQFNNIGVFEVIFNARDNDGYWDGTPDTRTITVDPGYPDAVIDLPTEDVTILRHQSVEFAGTATDDEGEIVDFLWTFGEGSGIDDMHVEDPGPVQFDIAGVFTVTFNAQDDDGYWDPLPGQRTVTVNEAFPDAVIDLPADDVDINAGDYVEFAGTAADENGEVVDWLWTFGEGSGIDDIHVEDPGPVQFNNAGVFTVTFNARDDDGNWDPSPDERTVRVNPAGTLWDQLSASGTGFASQDFEPGYDSYDCLTADDFVVTGGGWIIEQVAWDALLYYGNSVPVHGINIYIMPDRGDNLGDYDNPVYYEFAPVYTVYQGTNTVTLTTPVVLAPGHYFFGVAPALDFGSYSKHFSLMTDLPPVGQEAHMINPNGGFGSGTDWFQPTEGYDASFRLYGQTLEGAFPDAVIDLPLGNAVIQSGQHVLFAGTATDEDGEIVDWLWTFGEGSGIDDMHVEDPGYVQFNNLGVFEVVFNAQDNDGNWDWDPDSREVTVKASRVYVDRDSPGPDHNGLTWDTALETIEQGVTVCLPGGEVWVADGTYVGNVVMPPGAAIYGGFLGAEEGGYETERDQRDWVDNVTTIDGNQSGICVVMAADARVDGFTITNGAASHGGGFYCLGLGDSGGIINNTIVANAAAGKGGGVYCNASSPSIENNTFAQNHSRDGAAINCYESSPAIIGNVMMENTADDGGALHCTYHSSPLVTGNTMIGNSAGYNGGAVYAYRGAAPIIVGNDISDNSAGSCGGGVWQSGGVATLLDNSITGNVAADMGGGVYCRSADPPSVIANNTVVGNSATGGEGGGIFCGTVDVTNNTISWNHAASGGGIGCTGGSPSISNNIVANNSADSGGGGIFCKAPGSPTLSHNDFWANTPEDYHGCPPGEGDISDDPMFVDPEAGDFHLDPASPCIDMGDNDAPGLQEEDFEGDPRIVDGDGDKIPEADIGADECVSRCWPTEAPDPEPYCDGPLFGEPASGFPGWVWFSIPLHPSDCCEEENCYDPETLLGFGCSGKLWYWDRYGKTAQVYQPPFLEWDLAIGDSYLLYLESGVENPSYWGVVPPVDFEVRLGRQGWTWVGVPALYELGFADFMDSVRVQYPVGGTTRTAGEDYNETPYGRNWVVWGWAFWDTYSQAPRTFTPYSPFGNNTCYPWLGYRCWVNVGTAQSADDPDQVTLIWP